MENLDLNERIIHTWLEFNFAIKESRYLKNMTFNEIAIAHYLSLQDMGGERVTATMISEKTGLLKSHINAILNDMIDKGYVVKERCETDKRVFEIKFTDKGRKVYEEDHKEVLKIADEVRNLAKDEEIEELLKSLSMITQAFRKSEAGFRRD